MRIDGLPVTKDARHIWFWHARRYRALGYRIAPTTGWPLRRYAELEEMEPFELIDVGPPPTYRHLGRG